MSTHVHTVHWRVRSSINLHKLWGVRIQVCVECCRQDERTSAKHRVSPQAPLSQLADNTCEDLRTQTLSCPSWCHGLFTFKSLVFNFKFQFETVLFKTWHWLYTYFKNVSQAVFLITLTEKSFFLPTYTGVRFEMNPICHCSRFSLLPLICPPYTPISMHIFAQTHYQPDLRTNLFWLTLLKWLQVLVVLFSLTLLYLQVWVQRQIVSKTENWR